MICRPTYHEFEFMIMISFSRAMLCTARYCHSIASVCLCLSVCLSVMHCRYRYRAHIGWNSSKIISRQNSLRLIALADLNMGDLVQREHPKNYGRIEVEPGAHKSCHICEMVQDIDRGYYYGLIGSRIRAFDWHQNQ